MANQRQLAILHQGAGAWNRWRIENSDIEVDLSKADLSNANLDKYDFYRVDLSEANLREAKLRWANLTEAKFSRAKLFGADLSRAISNLPLDDENTETRPMLGSVGFFSADLRKAKLYSSSFQGGSFRNANLNGADLSYANLSHTIFVNASLKNADLFSTNLREAALDEADLSGADLSKADLTMANLEGAVIRNASLSYTNLVQARVNKANISNSRVYGVNVWDLYGEFMEQAELVITAPGESAITVDNIKVAQFVYLLLNNKEIRDVLNTLTSKTVLILGRFSLPERKEILDALRNKLCEYNLLPIVFDFERPTDKDFTETIKTLAGICYFVIADVTNPKSSPLELQATVPDYQIPFVPIIQEGENPFAMMVDLQKKYHWVLPTKSYDSIETLMQALKPGIIDPAVEMRNKLRLIKAQEHPTESLRDYLDKTL